MSAYKWHKAAIADEASRYRNRGAFRMGSKQAYEAARRQNILEEMCSHMAPPQYKRNVDDVITAAKPYNTMSEFIAECPKDYDSARKNGWLAVIRVGMEPATLPWTENRIRESAFTCESRMEFKHEYYGGYQAAQRLNILDSVCAHMIKKPKVHVYMYADTVNAYVGISGYPDSYRHQDHKRRNDAVGELTRSVSLVILTKDKIPWAEARELEKNTIIQMAKTHRILNIQDNPQRKGHDKFYAVQASRC